MSMKIENGKKIVGLNINEIWEWQKPIRQKIEDEIKRIVSAKIALDVVNLIEQLNGKTKSEVIEWIGKRHTMYANKTEHQVLSSTPLEIAHRSALHNINTIWKKENVHNSLKDFNIQATLHILPIDEELFAIFRSHQTSVQAILNTSANVEDYSYWDNTEKPKHIPKADWNKRYKKWMHILQSDDSIEQLSITIEFTKPFIKLKIDDIIDEIPSFQDRIFSVAKKELYENYLISDDTKLNQKEYFETKEGQNDIYTYIKSGKLKTFVPEDIIRLSHLPIKNIITI